MKTTAFMTARVMEAVDRLPGIATLDWCDRAASALVRLLDPSAALAAVGTLDGSGLVTGLEVIGAGSSGQTAPRAAGEAALSGTLQDVCQAVRPGQWIGWQPKSLDEEGCWVGTAAELGINLADMNNPLARRWAGHNPAEVLLGVASVPDQPASRVVIVEIATPVRDAEAFASHQAVLAACLPMIARRLSRALGPASASAMVWLTPREELVLWNLVAGKKVPQIAKELHRSIYTVHDHVKALHRKLGASNRGQLVARALGHIGPASAILSESDTEIVSQGDGLSGEVVARAASPLPRQRALV